MPKLVKSLLVHCLQTMPKTSMEMTACFNGIGCPMRQFPIASSEIEQHGVSTLRA